MPGTGGLFATPRALTDDEVVDLVARFARTAGIVCRAGFDGVQVHAPPTATSSASSSPR